MSHAKLTLARRIALDVLSEVEEKTVYPEDRTEYYYSKHGQSLKRLDKNFITEIVWGTLRWKGKLFWILQNTATRDLMNTSAAVRSALLAGAYQIYYMDRVPDRAAVSESVEYLKSKNEIGASKFVNGILRQIAKKAQYFPKPDKEKKPIDYCVVQYSHPDWIVRRWQRMFKLERLEKLLADNNTKPPHSIRINLQKTKTEEIGELQSLLLKEEKNGSDRRPLRTCLHLKSFPNRGKDSLFEKGLYSIQDEASQLVPFLMHPQPEEIIIDLCAGKGIKTSQLMEMESNLASIHAVDSSSKAIALLKDNINRLQLDTSKLHCQTTTAQEFLQENAPLLAQAPEKTKILLDAPCSGLGVLRRHPEGKWQKDISVIKDMAKIQWEMISKTIEAMKKGSTLVYSVCSFENEECMHHYHKLVEEYSTTVEFLDPREYIPSYYRKYVTKDKLLYVYSGGIDSLDGFSSFIIRKI